jgi:hypothetical protein
VADVADVAVSGIVQEYLVDLARVTREHREVTLGLSPRGLLIWQRVAQARAHRQGRDFVISDDIQHVAGPQSWTCGCPAISTNLVPFVTSTDASSGAECSVVWRVPAGLCP